MKEKVQPALHTIPSYLQPSTAAALSDAPAGQSCSFSHSAAIWCRAVGGAAQVDLSAAAHTTIHSPLCRLGRRWKAWWTRRGTRRASCRQRRRWPRPPRVRGSAAKGAGKRREEGSCWAGGAERRAVALCRVGAASARGMCRPNAPPLPPNATHFHLAAGVVVDQAKHNVKGAVSKAGRAIESDEQRKRWGHGVGSSQLPLGGMRTAEGSLRPPGAAASRGLCACGKPAGGPCYVAVSARWHAPAQPVLGIACLRRHLVGRLPQASSRPGVGAVTPMPSVPNASFAGARCPAGTAARVSQLHLRSHQTALVTSSRFRHLPC